MPSFRSHHQGEEIKNCNLTKYDQQREQQSPVTQIKTQHSRGEEKEDAQKNE